MRQGQQELGTGLRPAPGGKVGTHLLHRLDRAHAQGNQPLPLDIDPQRDHVLRHRARVQVHSAQEHQQTLSPQIYDPWAGGFLEQQVAGEFVQATGLAQPDLSLGHATIPMDPQGLFRLEVEQRQLGACNLPAATVPIQHVAVDQATLRSAFVLLHPFSRGWSRLHVNTGESPLRNPSEDVGSH
ncbi:hypothetical protein D9M71_227420 [compost metagenome]